MAITIPWVTGRASSSDFSPKLTATAHK